MRAVDIIVKKRDGKALSEAEIGHIIECYVAGDMPDYQVSAWLMAVYFQGMTFEESAFLTRAMLASGRTLDLSSLPGPKIDKHSTGGVGDKISLILAPIAAACGLTVPMLCGRGLGHTGGTIDKLAAVPGFRTSLSEVEIKRVLADTGLVFMGQTESIVPADRLLYALRDVTGTIESVPLITASILSKKAAEGADGFVFDVKAGSGAFMKTEAAARDLARSLVKTARLLGKKAAAIVTAMDEPLGRMVGNLAEIRETVECLRGRMPPDIAEVTFALGSRMLLMGGLVASLEEGKAACRRAVDDGRALEKFLHNIRAQGGEPEAVADPLRIALAPRITPVLAATDGWVKSLNAYDIGRAAVLLGAGRDNKDSIILPRVCLELLKKTGDRVAKGETLCLLYAEEGGAAAAAAALTARAYVVGREEPAAGNRLLCEVDESCSG